eukprot:EG_transcript_7314
MAAPQEPRWPTLGAALEAVLRDGAVAVAVGPHHHVAAGAEVARALSGLEPCATADALQLLGLQGVTVQDKYALRMPFEALRGGVEAFLAALADAAQKAPSAQVIVPSFSDLSVPTCQSVEGEGVCSTPCSSASCDAAGVSLFAGEADAASLATPLYLEVGPRSRACGGEMHDWERASCGPAEGTEAANKSSNGGDEMADTHREVDRLVTQAVRRVTARASLSHHLRRVLAFAVHPTAAYVVCFHRLSLKQGMPRQHLQLLRIAHEAVSRIWAAETQQAANDPEWHLTRDGPLIVGALQAMGAPAALCRVQCFGSSMHRVYLLTFPQIYPVDDRVLLGVSAKPSDVTMALKVIRTTKAYQHESQLLDRIATNAAGDVSLGERDFYALGRFSPHEPGGPRWFRDPHLPDPVSWCAQDAEEGSVWWRPRPIAGPGGVILMAPGAPVGPTTARELWAAGCQSLQRAHANGVCHCDVRLPNFIRLRDGLQLVDFGLGVSLEQPQVVLDLEGEQGRATGGRLKGVVGPVDWRPGDDFEMLAEAVFLRSPLPPDEPRTV